MSAVNAYKHTAWSENCPLCVQLKARADAAIAALETENDRLKCCENCGVGGDCEDWVAGDVGPSCTPVHWTRMVP